MNDKIYALELSLLDPHIRRSPEKLNILLAEEFMEIGSSGRIYNKQDILTYLPLESPQQVVVEDFVCTPLSKDVILATYKAIKGNRTSLRSSIWKIKEKEWQMVFHQGTVRHN